MKSLFFINPAAGKGAAQAEIVSKIKSYFAQSGGEYEIITTRFAGDAEQQALKAAQSGEELKMFACGGEGTGYEVLNGIVGYENVQMGVIPCGSANDFLKYFGLDSKKDFLEREQDGCIWVLSLYDTHFD